MPEIFGLVRIAEIQAIRDSQWICARTGKVSRGFGDGDLPAFARVERAIHRIAIRGRRQNFVGVANEKNGGVRTGFHDRAGANGVIVLPINPILGRDCRIAQQLAQCFMCINVREIFDSAVVDRRYRGSRFCFTRVQWRFVSERFGWNLRGNVTVISDAHHAVAGDATNFCTRHVPFLEYFTHNVFFSVTRNDEHSLL